MEYRSKALDLIDKGFLSSIKSEYNLIEDIPGVALLWALMNGPIPQESRYRASFWHSITI